MPHNVCTDSSGDTVEAISTHDEFPSYDSEQRAIGYVVGFRNAVGGYAHTPQSFSAVLDGGHEWELLLYHTLGPAVTLAGTYVYIYCLTVCRLVLHVHVHRTFCTMCVY